MIDDDVLSTSSPTEEYLVADEESAAPRTGTSSRTQSSTWQLRPKQSRSLVTLQAGQSHTFQVTSQQAELDPATLTRRPVLRSANDLVAG